MQHAIHCDVHNNARAMKHEHTMCHQHCPHQTRKQDQLRQQFAHPGLQKGADGRRPTLPDIPASTRSTNIKCCSKAEDSKGCGSRSAFRQRRRAASACTSGAFRRSRRAAHVPPNRGIDPSASNSSALPCPAPAAQLALHEEDHGRRTHLLGLHSLVRGPTQSPLPPRRQRRPTPQELHKSRNPAQAQPRRRRLGRKGEGTMTSTIARSVISKTSSPAFTAVLLQLCTNLENVKLFTQGTFLW